MALFGGLFGGSKDLSTWSDRQLVRLIRRYLADPNALRDSRAKHKARAKAAMLVLGARPFSEDVFQLARDNADMGPINVEAKQALGMMGHARAAAVLVDHLKRTSGYYREEVVPILGQPRNESAVPALLKIALEHRNYFVVELALKTLNGIGTESAKAALSRFRVGPSRKMYVDYFASGSSEPVFTSALGQTPTAEELEEARRDLPSRARVHNRELFKYRFGSDADATATLERLTTHTDENRAQALELYLSLPAAELCRGLLSGDDPDDPRSVVPRDITAYPSSISAGAVRALIKEGMKQLAQRQKVLRAALTPERRAKIEAALQRKLDIA